MDVGIVSHDAGGAELISSWVLDNIDNFRFTYLLDGPALKIFQEKIDSNLELTSNESIISTSDWLLCGTSWNSNLEKDIVFRANESKVKVVSYIDHWINYEERFILNDKKNLPDEIWVGDDEAYRIAKKIFQGTKIVLEENQYFIDQKNKINEILRNPKIIESGTALYVCEPIKEHALIQYGNAGALGYDEKSAMKFFLDNYLRIDKNISKIIIRPHPSEDLYKYSWVKDYSEADITIQNSKTLIEQIMLSDMIFGCESMAMVVALIAKKAVFSSIPPEGRPCSLPHKEVIKMSKYLGKR